MKALFLGALLAVVAWFPLGCSEKTIYRPVIVRDTVVVTPPGCRCWDRCKDSKRISECMQECLGHKPPDKRPWLGWR